jgi:uncharacterized cupin superfamily protein
MAHWDDVAGARRAAGHLDAEWCDLGTAAGSDTVGLQRIRIAPDRWSTPAHIEHAEEEIFWVLAGSGESWQDAGAGPATHAVGPGDCLVHLARGEAHTLHAGPDGLDVLAFGQRALGGAQCQQSLLSRARFRSREDHIKRRRRQNTHVVRARSAKGRRGQARVS